MRALPALFHTGQTGLGSGLPGGHGIKMRYSDPMLLDDVAADFPDLTIVMAHPAVPWVDAQIAIVAHKANVYLDLSGYSPKYFPPQLVRALGRQLRTKALFGTDYPYVQLDRWKKRLRRAGPRSGAGAADLQGERAAGARPLAERIVSFSACQASSARRIGSDRARWPLCSVSSSSRCGPTR